MTGTITEERLDERVGGDVSPTTAGYPTPPDDDEDKDEDKTEAGGNRYDAIFAAPTAEPTCIAVQEWYADGSSRTIMLEPFPAVEGEPQEDHRLQAEIEWLRATFHNPSAIETGGALITVMPWAVPNIRAMGRLRSYRVVDADGVSQVLDEVGLLTERTARPGLPFPTLLTDPDGEPATDETPDASDEAAVDPASAE